jgi:hypothetical protein
MYQAVLALHMLQQRKQGGCVVLLRTDVQAYNILALYTQLHIIFWLQPAITHVVVFHPHESCVMVGF